MGFIGYLMNGDARRSLKKLDKMANKVEELESKYAPMSDSELKAQTGILKDRLKMGETLDDILYDAFAVVREASNRVLKMKHFHVQIIGGICLHQGRIAEMRTGEGKTLVSTLPAYLNALTGKGVHIVTVNDYLAKRDAEWMGKVHRFLGLSVGVVVPGMEDEDKKAAYRADITYATNNELGFDYLRDNLKTDLNQMVQRELQFAIVDEVDSILIDEARTPLIISGPGEKSSGLYEQVDRFVRTLTGGFEDERKAAEDKVYQTGKNSRKNKGDDELFATAEEAKRLLDEAEHWDYEIDRKAKTVHISEFGAEKAERFFGIENLGDVQHADLNHHIQQALKAHKLFHNGEDYIVNEDEVIIVDEFTGRLMNGRRYSDGLHQAIEAKEHIKIKNENKTYATVTFQNFFRLYTKLSGMTGTAKTEEAEFRTIYSLDVVVIPTNKPIKRIDEPDMIYSTVAGKKKAIVNRIIEAHKNGQPILIGTATVDKSEEIARLLIRNGIKHNILNAKNHEREAEIVAQAGRFGAVTISTNMAGRGTDILLGGNAEYLAKQKMRAEGYTPELIDKATSFAELDEEGTKAREVYQKYYEDFKKETDAEKEKVIAAGGLFIIGTERHESRRIDNQLRGRSGRQGDIGRSVFYLSLEDDLVKRFGGERMKSIYELFKMDEDTCLQSKLLSSGIENAQKSIEGQNFGARKNTLQFDDVMNKQRLTIYGERMKVIRGEDVHEQILKYIPDYVKKVLDETVDTNAMPVLWNEDELNEALEKRILPEGSGYVTRERLEKWDYELAVEKIVKQATKAYEEKIADIKAKTGADFASIERRVLLMNVDKNWRDHIDDMDRLRKGIGLRAYGQVDPVISYKKEGFDMFSDMVETIQNSTIGILLKVKLEVKPMPKNFINTQAPQRPAMRVVSDAPEEKQAREEAEKAEEKSVQKVEEKPVQKAEEKPVQKVDENSVQNAEEKAQGEVTGEVKEEKPTTQTKANSISESDFRAAVPEYKKVDVSKLVTNSPDGKRIPKVSGAKIGRNDPCPCGSGKKYKYCCGKN